MEYFDENATDKVVEIERMGFGFLKHIAKWTVNQKMYVALAKAYHQESRSLHLGTRSIPLNVEIVAHCFDLLNHGGSIKKRKTTQEIALCESLIKKTQAMLTHDVMCNCLHTHAALNVTAPTKIYWARHIYDEIIAAVTRFQDKGKKTVDGCIYVLLIIYLTANLHGELEEYSGQQPWVKSWPISTLENTIMEDVMSPSGLLSHMYSSDAGSSNSRAKVCRKKKPAAGAPKSDQERVGAHKKRTLKEKESDNASERGRLSTDNTPEVRLKMNKAAPESTKRSNSPSLRKRKSPRSVVGA
ncbi:hypothetical protein PIB30_077513 [Stylosanthes scabra]|uniref:Uncharacterized protein n=1 Tax=Stylosanthes scabra TaxID=79078 RepID=A0ABU6UU97_9FABA|nr:hypothetical protein [Stylosanthes scabra]